MSALVEELVQATPGASTWTCANGHSVTPERTKWTRDSKGRSYRVCGECRRETVRRNNQKRQATIVAGRPKDWTRAQRRTEDVRERFMKKVRVDAECWIWTGAKNPGGYGVVGVGRRSDGTRLAHRLAYEIFVGPIPEGLHLDHLCVTPACVNPAHLEPVTQQENNRRERERSAK